MVRTYIPPHKRKGTTRELKHDRFYSQTRWKKHSAWYRMKHPLCVKCGQAAHAVDHLVPIARGGAEWDEGNMQSLCERCHNAKTNEERARVSD